MSTIDYAALAERIADMTAWSDVQVADLRTVVELLEGMADAPEGWQLVPKESTQAMNNAGLSAVNQYGKRLVWKTYRAMLAAAPHPAPQPQPTDSYDAIWNALHEIDSVAVMLPTFGVKHEGGIEAFTKNIVEAIQAASRALAQPQPTETKAALQRMADNARELGLDYEPQPQPEPTSKGKPGFVQQIENSRENVKAWPQWMQDATVESAATMPKWPAPQPQPEPHYEPPVPGGPYNSVKDLMAALHSDEPTEAQIEPPRVVKTAPERIYLVIGEDCPDDATFSGDEVTWCADKIDDNSIPYVRADRAALAAKENNDVAK